MHNFHGDPIDENLFELLDLSIPSSLIAESYKSMVAYGNHFRALVWLGTLSMVTYDCGVLGEFEHTPPITKNQIPQVMTICYIGECKEILELDYGGTKVVVLLCSWVQPRTHGPHARMKKMNMDTIL